jgi:hypothetical protein
MDKKEVADYLAGKVFNREFILYDILVMLKNKQIYYKSDYNRLIESNKISPEDAFVYIDTFNNSEDKSYSRPIVYLFPLIDNASIYGIVGSYLVKLGFYDTSFCGVYPATGLKYYAAVRLFSDRLVIEIVDIDTVVTNTGLRKIVAEVLGKSILTRDNINSNEKRIIERKLREQKLFAGYDSDKAYKIIYRYYMNHDTSLAKEVLAINNAYNRVFEPYRAVYDTRTRQRVLM